MASKKTDKLNAATALETQTVETPTPVETPIATPDTTPTPATDTAPATDATPTTDTTPETTVVTFGLAAIKARAEVIFVDLADKTKQLDVKGQGLVVLVAEAFSVYINNPSVKVGAIAEMIDSHHKRQPAYTHFLGMLKLDLIGAPPTAITNENASEDTVNDMAKYKARVTALSDACKAFVAIMTNTKADPATGKVRLWDENADCLICPTESFKPTHVSGVEKAFRWCDDDDDMPEYVTLNGGVWACQRKAINRKTGKEFRQVESGNYSMRRLLLAFYRTPDALKSGSESKSEPGTITDAPAPQGPDGARNDTPDFWGHMKAAHAIMFASDTKLPTLAEVDGIPNSMDVLRDFGRLYTALAQEATERAQSLARATPATATVIPISDHATATPTPAEPIVDAVPDATPTPTSDAPTPDTATPDTATPTPDTKPARKPRAPRKLAA